MVGVFLRDRKRTALELLNTVGRTFVFC